LARDAFLATKSNSARAGANPRVILSSRNVILHRYVGIYSIYVTYLLK
jgi:hypothetical protein